MKTKTIAILVITSVMLLYGVSSVSSFSAQVWCKNTYASPDKSCNAWTTSSSEYAYCEAYGSSCNAYYSGSGGTGSSYSGSCNEDYCANAANSEICPCIGCESSGDAPSGGVTAISGYTAMKENECYCSYW
jgi:hypothetical protein